MAGGILASTVAITTSCLKTDFKEDNFKTESIKVKDTDIPAYFLNDLDGELPSYFERIGRSMNPLGEEQKNISGDRMDPEKTIFCDNVSHTITHEALQEKFSEHGQVKNLRTLIHKAHIPGKLWVEYETQEDCQKALEAHGKDGLWLNNTLATVQKAYTKDDRES